MSGKLSALYTNTLNPDLVRQVVAPAAAVAASGAVPLWGAWSDLVLPAAVLLPTLCVGFSIDTPSVLESWTIQIGNARGYANAAAVTAAGAAAIAAAARQTLRTEIITLVGAYPIFYFKFPIVFNPGEGIIARSGTVGGTDTINVSPFLVTGF